MVYEDIQLWEKNGLFTVHDGLETVTADTPKEALETYAEVKFGDD